MILLTLIVLSHVSLATKDVHLFSTKTVGVPGDNFGFLCTNPSRTALSVLWLVNGTLLENSRLVNVFQHFDGRSIVAELSFNLPLEHNVTTIQCIYNFASENTSYASSETITLLLQGLLSAVGSPFSDLGNANIFLTWIAPFTLNISNVDPDITYCVDVVNSTSSSIVLSECGITVTGFNFSIPIDSVCDNLNIFFNVTPVNVVGNGTAVTLGYSITAPIAREDLLLPISESTFRITMSAPVCYGELTLMNKYTGGKTHIQGSDLNITRNTITFTNENIPKNQLYTVCVNASNINGSAVSYVSLSSDDVMKATFDVTSHTITTEYFEYSTAIGALYIFIFINEDRSIDFNKSIYLPLDRSSSHNYTLPDISPGQYQMSVYDIDSNVTLHDSVNYPANTNMFSVISDDPQASYSQTYSELQDCSVTYVDDVISAICSYSNDSSVTGFQIIVQLNDIDEVYKLHINCTNEHLSPGPVTVQVEENGTYNVVIFPIMGENGIVDTTIVYSEMLSVTKTSEESSQRWITGVVVSLVLLLLLIIVGVEIGIYYRKHYFKKIPVIENNYVERVHPPITMMPISIESNTVTPDSGITSTDSTAQNLGENANVFRHLYDSDDISTVQTLPDCGSIVAFMSLCGPLRDPSSCDVCKLSSEVTCANNVDVSNEYDSMVTGVEENARSQKKVSFLPKRDSTGQDIVPFLSERERADQSSPERKSTDQEIVPSSLEREFTDQEIVSFSEPIDIGIAPSSLKRESTGQEIVLSAPSAKKGTAEIFPSSNKHGLVDRRATMFIILLIFVMPLPVSMVTNDKYVHLFFAKTVGISGDNFTFHCSDQSRTALSAQWLVNGTLLENSRLVVVFQHYNSRTKTAVLSFNLPLEHNVTTIQCIYNFVSGNVSSETITVLLQGLLAAVGSPSVDLVDTDISLTWTAPFTLDISNVDPDMTYCVDVVNSTSSSIVLSECGITVTGFNFSIPIGRVCDNLNFSFTVTPVNRAGNGTAVTLGYSQDILVPRASTKLMLPISESTYQITMSAPVCYGELTVNNDYTGDETHLQGSDLNITINVIIFTNEKLKKNQFYTVSVNASNINGSAVSYVSLSTHDIMNTTLDVTSHTITTEYFEYSTAMGALYIFIFIYEDKFIDFKKSIYLPLDRSSSHNYTLSNISPGQYQMFVFDIDRDVTLHDSVSYPADTDMFSVISDDSQASYSRSPSSELLDCSVTYVDDVISAMCSYSGGSSVTGFQMIVQLNNVTEVHKLFINGTTEHLSPGPVTVLVEENGACHIAIFPVMGKSGIVDTTIAYSEVLSARYTQPSTTEVSKESSQGWKIAVGVVVPLGLLLLLLIIIIVGVGIRYRCLVTTSFEVGNCPINSGADRDTESEKNSDVFRHLYDAEDSISTVQTLQDCGSSVPFISQCGLSHDPSSVMTIIKTCSTDNSTGVHSIKSSHVALKPATKISNDSNVKLVYLETKSSSDVTCSIIESFHWESFADGYTEVTCANNMDISNECDSIVARVEINMSQNDVEELIDDRQCHSPNKTVCVCVAEQHEENVQSQENISSSPERESTDQEIVSSSSKREPTDIETAPNLLKRKCTVLSVPSDKKETTNKGIFPSSIKNGLVDRRATMFIILLMFVMLLPVSMTTNDVHLFTTKTVGIPGDIFILHCYNPSRTALSVQWLVNGSLLKNSTLDIVFQHYNNITKTADLNFGLPLEHNVTTIQCIYNFASKNVSSETITVLLQGLLSAVGSPSVDLVGTDISLTWTAPFTLDISRVDPDITYCVDVIKSTSSSIVLSECGITVTGFNFSIPLGRLCDDYTFTVTPVNGAGNGTTVTLGYSQEITGQSTSSKLQDCNVTYVDDVISAMCSYFNDSSLTGFQVIVQSNNITEVHKLHINCTTEHLSPGPVTVQVEESGTYHVAIFPTMGERGIVNTTIAYSKILPDYEPQTLTPETSKENSHVWIIGVVVVLLVLIIVAIVCLLLYLSRRTRCGRLWKTRLCDKFFSR